MNGERRSANVERHAKSTTFAVRRSAFAVLAALILNSEFLILNSSAQEPSFKSGSSELVVLPVVVTDKQGRYVSDVPGAQFAVYDNGRRVPIELFSNEDSPVTVGLVIDASGSMRPKIGEVIAASLRFARLSNPQDELFAVRFNDDVRDVMPVPPFVLASDLANLEKAVTSIHPDGRTALYDGVMDGLDHLSAGTRGRKVLIVISDGGDNASNATLDAVLARSRASNAAIYTIGYVPPARDGAYHRVKVQIDPQTPRKLNVRTRPGYFAAGRATQP